MAAIKTDGLMNFGTQPTTIGGVVMILDNITISRPSKTVEQTDNNDEPSKQRSYPGFVTGSATVQYVTDVSPPPSHGDEFTDDFGFGDETFYIDSVETPFAKDQ